MCNSVFAEDENAAEMARFQLTTMREYVAAHATGDPQ